MQKKLRVQLKDILSIETLAGAEVLAGSAGLDNEITSVNVMEVPDIVDWVRPGEFLLTTAYPLSTKIDSLNSLLPALKDAGVCGIGIKTKRYIDEVPKEVLVTAEALDFPIILIPHEASFGDLIREVLTYIVGEQTRLLEQINSFSNQVKAIMLQRGGMDQFAELIYSVVKAPLVIADDVFNRYTFFAGSPEWETKLAPLVEKAVGMPEKVGEITLNEVRHEQDSIDGEGIRRIVIPTFYDNTQYGKILLWDVNQNISERDIFIIQSESSLIALNTITRITIVERENVHRSNFLEQLLSGDHNARSRAIADADFFNFDPQLEHQCVILSLNKVKAMRSHQDDASILKLINTLTLRINQQVQRDYHYRFISASRGYEIIFVLEYESSWNDEKKEEGRKHFCEMLYQIAKREHVEELSYIGIGNRVPGAEQLCDSYDQACHVVRIIEGSSQKRDHITSFDDLGLLKLFGQPEFRDQLLEFSNDVLKPLLEYDTLKDGQLIQTVSAYFTYAGNLKRVSEVLFTHYNTIIYRMNRIRDLLRIDLRDPDTAFDIQLALRIREMLD